MLLRGAREMKIILNCDRYMGRPRPRYDTIRLDTIVWKVERQSAKRCQVSAVASVGLVARWLRQDEAPEDPRWPEYPVKRLPNDFGSS